MNVDIHEIWRLEEQLEKVYDDTGDYPWWSLTSEEREYFIKGYLQCVRDSQVPPDGSASPREDTKEGGAGDSKEDEKW